MRSHNISKSNVRVTYDENGCSGYVLQYAFHMGYFCKASIAPSTLRSSASEARPEVEAKEKSTHVVVFSGGDAVSEEAASQSKRRQELTLDLGTTATAAAGSAELPPDQQRPDASALEATDPASESGLIWQRVNMGTGEVQKKRAAFEQQIKSQVRGSSSTALSHFTRALHELESQEPGTGLSKKL